MFNIAVIILVGLFFYHGSCVGFGSDGGIEQVKFAQNAVVRNDMDKSIIAIKCDASTIVLETCKNKISRSLIKSGPSSDDFYDNQLLRAILVGKCADCQQARLLCSGLDRQARINTKASLTAPRLSLQLADIAHKYSLGGTPVRQLAFNALVLNTDVVAKQGFGDVYKVDVGGNFFKCKAVCIGSKSERINAWLNDRGKALLAGSRHDVEGDIHDNGQARELQHPTAIDKLFNVSAHCLLDNYPVDDFLSGNVSVWVTVLQRAPEGRQSVHGPRLVPREVLEQLVQAKNRGQGRLGHGETIRETVQEITSGLRDEDEKAPLMALSQWWSAHADSASTLENGDSDETTTPTWMRHS